MKKKLQYVFESLIFFLIFDVINIYFFPEDPGFKNFALHPYWIAILLISSRYGFVPGIVVSSMGVVSYLAFRLEEWPTITNLQEFIENDGILLPISFLIVGAFLGAIRQKYRDLEENMLQRIEKVEQSLKVEHQKTETEYKIRRNLEKRIVGEASTINTLYDIAKKFETLDIDSIYKGCLEALAERLDVTKSTMYFQEGDYYVLKAEHGVGLGAAVEGKKLIKDSIMKIPFETNKPTTVKDILAREDAHLYADQYNQVLAMFPVRNESGEPIGVVNIEQMDFVSFNKPNLHIVDVVVDWMSRALYIRKRYEDIEAQLIFDKEYGIYRYNYLSDMVQREFNRAREYNVPVTLSFFKIDRYGFVNETVQHFLTESFIAIAKRFVNVSDMLFHYKFYGVYALISPMKRAKDVEDDFSKIIEEWNSIQNSDEHTNAPKLIVGDVELSSEMENAEDWFKEACKKCKIMA